MFASQTLGVIANTASMGASVQRTTGASVAVPVFAGNLFEPTFSSIFSVFHYPAGNFYGTLAMPGSGIVRLFTGADGATRTNCVNSTCESTAVVSTNFTGPTFSLVVGREGPAAKYVDSVVSRICADPSATRCR